MDNSTNNNNSEKEETQNGIENNQNIYEEEYDLKNFN